ncbi:MAG: hypothetical protein ACFE85_08255 [Candidatus Hodarchaeota archaeon]
MNLHGNGKEINKIRIISEIDQLKVIVNNHFLMKRYNEALRVSERIIELAKSVELKSMVKEQEEFITEITKHMEEKNIITYINEDFEIVKKKFISLISENQLFEAHKIIQKFKQKFENLYNLKSVPEIEELLKTERNLWDNYSGRQTSLKKQLEPLEIQLNSYLSTNNMNLAVETLNKAKNLIKDLKDLDIIKKWERLETMVLELKKQTDTAKNIEESIEQISKLTDSYQFEDAKRLIDSTIELAKIKDLSDYKRNLSVKKKAILDAEEKYNKLLNDIKELEDEIKKNLSNYSFEKAQDNCEQIIKISRFIGKSDYVDIYTQLNNDIKERLRKFNRLEKLKRNVKDLNSQGLVFLSEGDFNEALAKFLEIKKHLESFSL